MLQLGVKRLISLIKSHKWLQFFEHDENHMTSPASEVDIEVNGYSDVEVLSYTFFYSDITYLSLSALY